MNDSTFHSEDLQQLADHGIAEETAGRQLGLYRNPPAYARLNRPCTVGDGILRLDDPKRAQAVARYEAAANSLELAKFVPASGAASRMFRSLSAVIGEDPDVHRESLARRAEESDADAAAALEVFDHLDQFAFREDLAAVAVARGLNLKTLVDEGRVGAVLRLLLEPSGLDYAARPKGLLHFHRGGNGFRRAVEEHLVEAAQYARGSGDRCRLHLTVSPEHMAGFKDLLADVVPQYEKEFGVHYDVEYSVQSPSTDAVAVTPENEPFRDDHGRLLFRPGGHGALIGNLASVSGDVVFVKNIDNVVVDERKALTAEWKKALAGHLLEVQSHVFSLLAALESGGGDAVVAEALTFLDEAFSVQPADGQDARMFALDRLARPLRVCGMVENEGEPGGGPFWSEDSQGSANAQIVETSQVDPGDAGQRDVLSAATHFNPVDLVCAPRDRSGKPYDLSAYVDHDAVFIASKSHLGRPLKSLELPGLWNGAMAGWNTVFVEVPIDTFHPVKTVNDLLRPAHQA